VEKLIDSPSQDRSPFWSYDGRYIFFNRLINGREKVVYVELGSEAVHVLDHGPGRATLAAASPDSRYVLLTANRLLGWNVYIHDLQTGETTPYAKGYGGCRAKYSHDGTSIAWVSHKADGKGDIYLSPAGGFAPVRLTIDNQRHDYCPEFSPCDRYIAYASGPSLYSGNYDIMIMDIASRKVWQVTHSEACDMLPTWAESP